MKSGAVLPTCSCVRVAEELLLETVLDDGLLLLSVFGVAFDVVLAVPVLRVAGLALADLLRVALVVAALLVAVLAVDVRLLAVAALRDLAALVLVELRALALAVGLLRLDCDVALLRLVVAAVLPLRLLLVFDLVAVGLRLLRADFVDDFVVALLLRDFEAVVPRLAAVSLLPVRLLVFEAFAVLPRVVDVLADFAFDFALLAVDFAAADLEAADFEEVLLPRVDGFVLLAVLLAVAFDGCEVLLPRVAAVRVAFDFTLLVLLLLVPVAFLRVVCACDLLEDDLAGDLVCDVRVAVLLRLFAVVLDVVPDFFAVVLEVRAELVFEGAMVRSFRGLHVRK